MRRIFFRWAIFVGSLFIGCSIFGQLLSAYIEPSNPYQPARAPMPPTAPVPSVSRNFTNFQAASTPSLAVANQLEQTIREVTDRNNPNDGNIPGLAFPLERFDLQRMAEEELPLGVYSALAQPATFSHIQNARSDLTNDLMRLAQFHRDLLPDGQPKVQQVRSSPDRRETLAIVKHTITKDGKQKVEYRRWWFILGPDNRQQVYDFDYPNTRLRFLAARKNLLGESIRTHPASNTGLPATLPARDVVEFKRYTEVVKLLDRAVEANDIADEAAVRQLLVETCDIPLVNDVGLANDAACLRVGILRKDQTIIDKHAPRVAEATKPGVISMLARISLLNHRRQHADVLKSLLAYRSLVGDDTWTYREEAKAVAATKDEAAAIAILQKGLTVFPNDEGLQRDLAHRESKLKEKK